VHYSVPSFAALDLETCGLGIVNIAASFCYVHASHRIPRSAMHAPTTEFDLKAKYTYGCSFNKNGNGPTAPGATSPKILLLGLYYEHNIINLSSLQSTISFSHNKTRYPTLVHKLLMLTDFQN